MQARVTRWLSALLAASLAPALQAQCANVWLPGEGFAGTNSTVRALTSWDPDGPGPASALVVVAGDFTAAGSTPASRIATWDPVSGLWSPIGSGFDSGVYAAVAMPNGDLIAGGNFSTAGGTPATRIARWNGTTWTALGSGILGGVYALAVRPNGDLIVGGQFSQAGSSPANNIARWDGASWSPLGTGMNGIVYSLAVLPNGDVLAGGSFSFAGSTPASKIARWDGTTWHPVSATTFNERIYALAVMPNGDFVAGGDFTTPAARIARWNGVAWVSMFPGFGATSTGISGVNSLHLAANGDLFAGGSFPGGVSRWNGFAWATVSGGTNNHVAAVLALPGGDLVAVGAFTAAGTSNVSRAARWSSGAWLAMGSGMSGPLTHLRAMPNGDVFASAAFTSVPDLAPGGGPALWNGTTWSGLGPAPSQPLSSLQFAGTGAGQLFMSGNYNVPLTVNYQGYVFRRFGSFWSALSATANDRILCIEGMADGSVVIGGDFTTIGTSAFQRIARWNGSTWAPLGSGLPGTVDRLVGMPDGDVVALYNGDTLARWNGSSWTQLGTVSGFLNMVIAAPNGDLVVGGTFTAVGGVVANNIARWNGSTWATMGSGLDVGVTSASVLPGGDLAAAGHFSSVGGTSAGHLARWDGTTWSALGGAGLDAAPLGLAVDRLGRLVAGGPFWTADGSFSAHLAMLASTCPATASSSATGCNGNTLVALTLPWVETTLRTLGTGLPTSAFVVATTSFTSIPRGALPLVNVFAQAMPGCDLLVQPDVVQPLATTTGSAESSLFLPNVPPLVGLTFFHQMIPFGVDTLGTVTNITATNALQLTAGAF